MSSRLDRWGVIPQVIAVAWIRDNYLALVPPFGWEDFKQLFQFMRLRGLWPFLIGPIIAAIIIYALDRFAPWKRPRLSDQAEAAFAGATAARLAALLLFFIVIALLVGRAQSISFERLSTFFVPLLVLFAIAGGAWLLNGSYGRAAIRGPGRCCPPCCSSRCSARGRARTIGRGDCPRKRPMPCGFSPAASAWRRLTGTLTAATPLARSIPSAQRGATVALRNADLEHQCRFLLHGARLPDRKRHFLQNVRAAG